MTTEEIIIRQLTNQHLITPADRLSVVRDLCGLQAQFLSNAFHAMKIRAKNWNEQSTTEGLVKNWTLRGTVHVFAESDLPLFVRCNNGSTYRSNDWSGRTFWNQRDKWALTPERQRFFSNIIISAVVEHPRTRDELKEICRASGMTASEEDSIFDPWGGGIRELCERGFMNYAVEETKRYVAAPTFTPVPEDAAWLEIVRRYFTHYGPATLHDASYFLDIKQAEIKKHLAALPVEAFDHDGRTYYHIPRDISYEHPIPDCIFLAGFDPLMLGYQKKESLYLPGEHLREIFNLSGIVMPAILLHGRVVGRWKKKNNHLAIALFGASSSRDKEIIAQEANRLWGDFAIKFE